MTEASNSHPTNADSPIDCTDGGIVADVSGQHPWKTQPRILVTELEIVTDITEVVPVAV